MRDKMMQVRRVFALGVAAMAMSAGVATAQKITTDYDHKADFHDLHTFSLYKVQASNQLVEGRLRDGLERELTSRGMQEVPSGGDVAVTAIGGTHNQQEYNSFYTGLGGGGFGWGGRRGWGMGGFGDTTTTVSQIPVGTLVVDLYSGGTHQMIWRGTATTDLSSNPDKNAGKLTKALDKMFSKYPPKGAS